MWIKWLPWRFLLRHLARSHGFTDPLFLFNRLSRFAKPSKVVVPLELLRTAALLHARGLINSQAIQHNLDWVWPYWVERQFNPKDTSFIPRAFSLTHINLTHRNWTAIGKGGLGDMPIVDPHGLLTPLFDGWSLDSWLLTEEGVSFAPSRLYSVKQSLRFEPDMTVETRSEIDGLFLTSFAGVVTDGNRVACKMRLGTNAGPGSRLIISLRPYNPEGVSFIHRISADDEGRSWVVNGKERVIFNFSPEKQIFCDYERGDVYSFLKKDSPGGEGVKCDVGMATAAAFFSPREGKEIEATIPIKAGGGNSGGKKRYFSISDFRKNQTSIPAFSVENAKIRFLYESSLHAVLLLSSEDIYAGPFTYKNFWFRDAVFILYSLLCYGLSGIVKEKLEKFFKKQTPGGYFLSQNGEWDSNGQVLWLMKKITEIDSSAAPPQAWKPVVRKGARWIKNKRTKGKGKTPHSGLMPAGFSAEHLGPNDYYYWDDFWSLAGFKAASELMDAFGDKKAKNEFEEEAERLSSAIDVSLKRCSRRLGSKAMPASPYRRLDSGSVGSLVCGYPLFLWAADDSRLLATADYLFDNCRVNGGFFHDMSHSGINPYLTLHLAQVLMRAQDPRFEELIEAVQSLASPTGQWPEAVHPATGGGCMGDGQHTWAAAEWLLILRNSFLREEGGNRLVLCSGITKSFYRRERRFSFGPAPTAFGPVSIFAEVTSDRVKISWEACWRKTPSIEVSIPGGGSLKAKESQNHLEFALKEEQ
ncbi:MAG: hypothetical protein GF375_00175 [Candidatus Omnitrophica bacterium]|nr:hypothetical protein [Candidatus Omnitrophota bacterium]MBD3268585.1 hypothetical protein [Candidatus Omnitrophota bacterium]